MSMANMAKFKEYRLNQIIEILIDKGQMIECHNINLDAIEKEKGSKFSSFQRDYVLGKVKRSKNITGAFNVELVASMFNLKALLVDGNVFGWCSFENYNRALKTFYSGNYGKKRLSLRDRLKEIKIVLDELQKPSCYNEKYGSKHDVFIHNGPYFDMELRKLAQRLGVEEESAYDAVDCVKVFKPVYIGVSKTGVEWVAYHPTHVDPKTKAFHGIEIEAT